MLLSPPAGGAAGRQHHDQRAEPEQLPLPLQDGGAEPGWRRDSARGGAEVRPHAGGSRGCSWSSSEGGRAVL